MRFNDDVDLIFLQPHMHLRGKDMTVRLKYPTEKPTLCSTSHTTSSTGRLFITKHSPCISPKVHAWRSQRTGTNSATNRFNPDPEATVHLGPQNTDEMLVCFVGFTVDWRRYSDNLVTIEEPGK